ncbi:MULTISPECIES: hypothetical protein [unclassified Inquilinus]|uniref:hypothetical protein n=1 Tax=unclassified Inquilinus TaxID=2645927 RepID=UPI003F91DABD
MHISAAANVAVPAYLAILSKGYKIEPGSEPSHLIATRGDDAFLADDPITLLGLIAMAELRGEHWHATDQEIDDYLLRFGG